MQLTWQEPDLTQFETDEDRYEFTGEFRKPKKGECFWSDTVIRCYANTYTGQYPIIRRIRKRWVPKDGEVYWSATTRNRYVRRTGNLGEYGVGFANETAAFKAHEVLRNLNPETGEPYECSIE